MFLLLTSLKNSIVTFTSYKIILDSLQDLSHGDVQLALQNSKAMNVLVMASTVHLTIKSPPQAEYWVKTLS
jgi:hypothetical protein